MSSSIIRGDRGELGTIFLRSDIFYPLDSSLTLYLLPHHDPNPQSPACNRMPERT